MSEKILEFYKLDVECPNCHFSEKGFQVPKGKTLEELKCPQCGLPKLVKSIIITSYYNF